MLTNDESGHLAHLILSLKIRKQLEVSKYSIYPVTPEQAMWLAEKLREINAELVDLKHKHNEADIMLAQCFQMRETLKDECDKVHGELQKANEELARVWEVYGP